MLKRRAEKQEDSNIESDIDLYREIKSRIMAEDRWRRGKQWNI